MIALINLPRWCVWTSFIDWMNDEEWIPDIPCISSDVAQLPSILKGSVLPDLVTYLILHHHSRIVLCIINTQNILYRTRMVTSCDERPGPPTEGTTVEPQTADDVVVVESRSVDNHQGNNENGTNQVDEIDFPKSLLKRIVKEQVQTLGGKGVPSDSGHGDIQVNKDATLAFNEAAKIFIHYLTCAANDICMESKRQTIGVEDVFKALSDIDFVAFVEPLRESLEAFKSSKKTVATKRKVMEGDDGQLPQGEEDGNIANDDT